MLCVVNHLYSSLVTMYPINILDVLFQASYFTKLKTGDVLTRCFKS